MQGVACVLMLLLALAALADEHDHKVSLDALMCRVALSEMLLELPHLA